MSEEGKKGDVMSSVRETWGVVAGISSVLSFTLSILLISGIIQPLNMTTGNFEPVWAGKPLLIPSIILLAFAVILMGVALFMVKKK